MKLKTVLQILKENQGYWINPVGKAIKVDDHIEYVEKNYKLFGYKDPSGAAYDGYSAAFRKGWVRVIGTGREINIEFGEKVKPKPLKTAQKMSIGKKYAYVEDPWIGQLGFDLSKKSDIDKFKRAMKVS